MQRPIPLKNFYVSISESVTELCDKAKVGDILLKVEEKMKNQIGNYPKLKDRAEWEGMELMRSEHLNYTYPALKIRLPSPISPTRKSKSASVSKKIRIPCHISTYLLFI
jgi:hypothetical protein